MRCRFALAALILALAVTPASAQPVTVTCEVYELWATHGKGGADAAIPKLLVTRLQNDLKYAEYKLLANKPVKLDKKKPETVKLAKGSVKLELVEIVDKNQIRLNVDFTATTKKTTTANQTVAAADWLTVVAKTTKDATAEGHVLGVSCK